MRAAILLLLVTKAAWAAPKLELSGNHRVSSAELLAAIDSPFDAHGKLVEETLERDLLLISAYYWDRGYARVQVGRPVITPVTIRIPITEGERFTLGTVRVTGKARHALQLAPGDVFSRTAIANERARLARYYQERGYPHVGVVPLTNVDVAKRTIAVTFEIERGPQARVERVELACPAVPDAASVVTFGREDLYDIAQVDASKRAIAARGGLAGDAVEVTVRRGAADDKVVIALACR